MSAPVRPRDRPSGTSARGRERAGGRPSDNRTVNRAGRSSTTPTSRSSAAERAYARRAQRTEQAHRAANGEAPGTGPAAGLRAKLRPGWPRSRASFVLLIMAMLAAGVITTLWLSTQAIAGSYELVRLQEENARLSERVAQLQREVTKRESASWLAQRAGELGMVPAELPARIVVRPDGSVDVVGEPSAATADGSPTTSTTEPSPDAEQSDDASPESDGDGDSTVEGAEQEQVRSEGQDDTGQDEPGADDTGQPAE